MPGIYPEYIAGAVDIRDAEGDAIHPENVQNAYSPPPPFLSNCILTALPSDCTARIEPRQINAIVSELTSLAECFDPDGTWNCNTVQNLCTSFNTWVELNLNVIFVGDFPPPTPKVNTLFWESDTGYLFLYYDDGTSKQYVQVAGGTPVADGVSIIGNGSIEVPFSVNLIDCGSY